VLQLQARNGGDGNELSNCPSPPKLVQNKWECFYSKQTLKIGSNMKDRFSEAQMIGIIKEQESGLSVVEICRKYGIGDSTFYRWKAKYGGMDLKELQRLKHLETENRKLKRIVADLSLDKIMLQDVLSKKL
jgi:putative transposase